MEKRLSLQKEVFLYALIIGFTPLLLTLWVLQLSVNEAVEKRIEQEAIEIASHVSVNINVINTFSQILPDRELLQSVSNNLRERNGAHVVFLDIFGKALIDPYPPNYGLQVIGKEKGRALKGETYTTKVEGVSGRAIRAFAPIINDAGKQKGVAVVAFLEPDIKLFTSQFYNSSITVLPLTIMIIIALSSFLAHSIKRRIFGMEPIEIATLVSERESLFQSVTEAIIATNERLEITVANEAALSLFPKGSQVIGENFLTLIPNPGPAHVIETKKPEYNKQLLVNGEIMLANISPLLIRDRAWGIVVTLRNRAEIKQLAEELTGVRNMVQALRAKTHEFSNKLHVIYGLLQRGHYQEAERYVDRLAEEKSFINSVVNHVQPVSVRELLLGKASEAEERKIKLIIDSQSFLFELPDTFDENSMIVVLGNLIDNAYDAVEKHPDHSSVFISLKQDESKIEILVKDNGAGIPEENFPMLFNPGFTTKSKGTGFGLYNIKTQVSLAKGTIAFSSDADGTSFLVTIPYPILKKQKRGESYEKDQGIDY
ncbi:signal transduction histidine kinase regulating citrate/malate metabolism [Desulfitobacterium hafniense DCB-2]|uniref:histidine kinase n=1 Tax=Desulfitobacterium hafniense (strain DSM 10664 / DCB-2) TaxID=272564 RepID=B8G182_DESHD|nr:sensor histidine kinase [Desulfitobacterium hafniense]ACL19297.1 signal transduction histidine kinase regulating citrate/malate metabolism [Desulfitobacterium hafniense DCB-2]